jgi:hypothetical protein
MTAVPRPLVIPATGPTTAPARVPDHLSTAATVPNIRVPDPMENFYIQLNDEVDTGQRRGILVRGMNRCVSPDLKTLDPRDIALMEALKRRGKTVELKYASIILDERVISGNVEVTLMENKIDFIPEIITPEYVQAVGIPTTIEHTLEGGAYFVVKRHYLIPYLLIVRQ